MWKTPYDQTPKVYLEFLNPTLSESIYELKRQWNGLNGFRGPTRQNFFFCISCLIFVIIVKFISRLIIKRGARRDTATVAPICNKNVISRLTTFVNKFS